MEKVTKFIDYKSETVSNISPLILIQTVATDSYNP